MRRRKEREHYRQLKKGYYHLSTDGWKDGFLFHTKSQYAYGMTVIGMLTILFDVKIYSFTLMPNHIHIILSGTGVDCLGAFDYFCKMISARLTKDGCQPLPEDYWFKLVAIEDPQQMKNNIIYVDRNPYEQAVCVPSGYPWGSAYLHFSFINKMIAGKRADSYSRRELDRITCSRKPIPDHWLFHNEYGLLPSSFVDDSLFSRLFHTPKEYESRLVKDYEAFVKVARSLEESVEYAIEEAEEIVSTILRDYYSGRKFDKLSNDEKGQFANILTNKYNMSETLISSALNVSEKLIRQFLRAKDYSNMRPAR